jgi:hypothetical protein
MQGFDHRTLNIGQTEVAAPISASQSFVVDAEELEDGGVKVVEVVAAEFFALSGKVEPFPCPGDRGGLRWSCGVQVGKGCKMQGTSHDDLSPRRTSS